MPYTFSFPGFLDEYGRVLLRKGFGGFPGIRDGRSGLPNNLLDQFFPGGLGGPSRVPRREPRGSRDTGSVGGFSNSSDQSRADKGSINSLPKIKETAGKTAQLIYREHPLDVIRLIDSVGPTANCSFMQLASGI